MPNYVYGVEINLLTFPGILFSTLLLGKREFTAHAEFRSYWEAVLIGCGYRVIGVAVACCSVLFTDMSHLQAPSGPKGPGEKR